MNAHKEVMKGDTNEWKEIQRRKRASGSTRAADPTEALGLVKEMASANFDEAVDIAVGLGVDPP